MKNYNEPVLVNNIPVYCGYCKWTENVESGEKYCQRCIDRIKREKEKAFVYLETWRYGGFKSPNTLIK